MTTTLSYNDANKLIGEDHAGGTLAGLSITADYTDELKLEELALGGASDTFVVDYGYDAVSGRLDTVTDGTKEASYGYVANSELVEQIEFRQGNPLSLSMTTSRGYDTLNRLTSISSAGSGMPSDVSFVYDYNKANQRIKATLADGSYWVYQYDGLGQLASGVKYWPGGAPVAGQQFGYSFDQIGNRLSTSAGGDTAGSGHRTATYVPDLLNQYASRTVPNAFDVVGLARWDEDVQVNSVDAGDRTGEYFQHELAVNNDTTPVWQKVDIDVEPLDSIDHSGHRYVPEDPEAFHYDDDGNLEQDGRWDYTWNAENRLVQIVKRYPAVDQSTHDTSAFEKVTYEYDWQGRRIAKHFYTSATGTTPFVTYKFVYHGWNPHAMLDGSATPVIEQTYVWGLDLSGTMQGAGGVGGLLWLRMGGPQPFFCAYDGNGNVMALVNSSGFHAQYEYGPFGEVIRSSGAKAEENPFRFSTKFEDNETDMLYYGYRFYSSAVGRWINRDPADELSFRALKDPLVHASWREKRESSAYALLNNDPLNSTDYLGLWTCCCNGKRIDGTPVTVYRICSVKSDSDVDHGWIEIDESSAGFYAKTPDIFGGPGEVKIPDAYTGKPNKRCVPVKMSPCYVDIPALKARIWKAIWEEHFDPPKYYVLGNNCYDFVNRVRFKGYAAPPGCGNETWE
jgi:RHS repeat-associated protein